MADMETSPSKNPFMRAPQTKHIDERGILRLPNDWRAIVLLVLCAGMGVMGILSFWASGVLSWVVAIGSIAAAIFGVIGAYLQNAFCFFLCMFTFLCVSAVSIIAVIIHHDSYSCGVYLTDCFVGFITAFVCFWMRGLSFRPC
ncbi:hypothetical protein Pelo_14104 [Pelomyxa schiedti]|nr:hypothetical protein Pelo_14104 [Pelomyxa schiedti]